MQTNSCNPAMLLKNCVIFEHALKSPFLSTTRKNDLCWALVAQFA